MKKADVIQYIKDELNAGGLVNLELPNSVIDRNLERSLAYSSDYFSYILYKTVTLVGADGYQGGYVPLSELDNGEDLPSGDEETGITGVPTVVAVYPTRSAVNINSALLGLRSLFIINSNETSKAMQSYSQAVSQLSNLESILGRNAKVVGDKLFVANHYPTVTVAYIPQVVRIENIVEGTWARWLVDYTVALCKRQIAQSRGKFTVSSNPSQPNAATLLEEANAAITRLEAELEMKGTLRTRR